MKEEQDFELCAQRLKALADPDRLKIILRLFKGEMNVGDLAAAVEDEVVNVSHHLRVLRHANVVITRKDGRFVVYRLHPSVTVGPIVDGRPQIELGCCRVDLSEAPNHSLTQLHSPRHALPDGEAPSSEMG